MKVTVELFDVHGRSLRLTEFEPKGKDTEQYEVQPKADQPGIRVVLEK
jgi:hypothetical protein